MNAVPGKPTSAQANMTDALRAEAAQEPDGILVGEAKS